MKHTVRMAKSDYNLTYRGDIIPDNFSHLMVVLYQGNCSAPQIWSIISSVVFLELGLQGFGIHFVNNSID